QLLPQVRHDLFLVAIQQTSHFQPLTDTLGLGSRFRSHYFRGQTNYFQVSSVAQLASNGAEDTRAARVLILLVQDHHRVAVEADIAAVITPRGLLAAHNHSLDDLARLDVPAGNRFLHAGDDEISQSRIAPPRAAEHLDAHAFLGPSIVRHVQVCIHLN